MKATDHGHNAGTAAPEAVAAQRAETRHRDLSTLCPAWPRLLGVDQAAAYLGLSKWSVIEMIHAGLVRPVPVPRPRTPKALKTRPLGDTMRRQLLDRLELDAIVDQWRDNR